MFDHIWKQLFLTLISKAKSRRKFEDASYNKLKFQFLHLREKCHLFICFGYLRNKYQFSAGNVHTWIVKAEVSIHKKLKTVENQNCLLWNIQTCPKYNFINHYSSFAYLKTIYILQIRLYRYGISSKHFLESLLILHFTQNTPMWLSALHFTYFLQTTLVILTLNNLKNEQIT